MQAENPVHERSAGLVTDKGQQTGAFLVAKIGGDSMTLWERLLRSDKHSGRTQAKGPCEVEIPARYVEPLLNMAADLELPVEDVVERAIQNFIRRMKNGG